MSPRLLKIATRRQKHADQWSLHWDLNPEPRPREARVLATRPAEVALFFNNIQKYSYIIIVSDAHKHARRVVINFLYLLQSFIQKRQ